MPKNVDAWSDLVKGLGWGSIAIMTVVSIIRGWLWPGWTVTKLLADKDSQIESLWKAREADQATISSLTSQVHQMQHNGEMSLLLLEALRQAAAREGQNPVLERTILGGVAASSLLEGGDEPVRNF